MRRVITIAGVLLIAAGLSFLGWRSVTLQRSELEHLSPLLRLAIDDGQRVESPRQLTVVELVAGSSVTIEVCALDSLEPERWADAFELRVHHREGGEPLVQMPLTRAVLSYATRAQGAACLLLAYEEPVQRGGDYVVEARWSSEDALDAGQAATPLRARVLAHAPIVWTDELVIALIIALSLLIVIANVPWRERDGEFISEQQTIGRNGLARDLLRVGGAIAILLVFAFSLGLLPISGLQGAMIQGAAVAAAQVLLALLFAGFFWRVPEERGLDLAMVRPTRWWLVLVGIASGVGLWYVGDMASRLVPSTGIAPLQSFVASPGGALTVAALSAAAPLAEELFFRGFLYTAIATRLGHGVSIGVTTLLFLLAHLEQSWGAWGAVVALALTGAALGVLRWLSGSVVVPIFAHLAHNGVIVVLALTATRGG